MQNVDPEAARWKGLHEIAQEDTSDEDNWGSWTVKQEDTDGTCDMSSETRKNAYQHAGHIGESQASCPVMCQDRRRRVSKALSFVLRHGAFSEGVRLDAEGYGHVRDILESPAMSLLHVTLQELRRTVSSDEKNRFSIVTVLDQFYVKANEGHSIRGLDAQAMHTPVTIAAGNVPAVAIHGSFRKHLSSIRARGLLAGGLRGTREHVHFQTSDIGEDGVIAGTRADWEIAVYVDIPAALRDGVHFYLSANGVLLTPGVSGVLSARYIIRIVHLTTRRGL